MSRQTREIAKVRKDELPKQIKIKISEKNQKNFREFLEEQEVLQYYNNICKDIKDRNKHGQLQNIENF